MSQLDEIQSFVEIARAGSISAAARQNNIAKSALSRRLQELEARLGVELVRRTTRKLFLTDAGERFLARTTSILAAIQEAESEASEARTELAGPLRIAAPLSFGLKHLQPVISDFMRAHPKVDFDLDFSDRRIDLLEEGFDLAVRIGVLADSSLVARKLCRIDQVVAAAPSFWDQHGVPQSPDDLTDLACLRYSNLPNPALVNFWGPRGSNGSMSVSIKTLANNGDFLSQIAIDGHGFLIEPSFFLFEDIAAGHLQVVLRDYAWSNMNLFAVFPPTRHVSARVRAFIDELVNRFGNSPYWDAALNS